MQNEANIEIIRKDRKLVSVSLVMPKWNKAGIDNSLSVNLPLLSIRTFARDEEDADIAAKEAIIAFCVNSERFGKGLESELRELGWTSTISDEDHCLMVFNVSDNDIVFDQLLQTGEQFAQQNLPISELV